MPCDYCDRSYTHVVMSRPEQKFCDECYRDVHLAAHKRRQEAEAIEHAQWLAERGLPADWKPAGYYSHSRFD